jgi:SAM-dependent methyltransferase
VPDQVGRHGGGAEGATGPRESWASGGAYEPYIGRWSRLIAREFVRWLPVEAGTHWLELGCGTGALTASIVELAAPALVVASDRSAAYTAYARGDAPDDPVWFAVADAMRIPLRSRAVDAVVSGLLLNFLPDPAGAVVEMARVLRIGGVVAAYVWDYAGRMELLRVFWDTVVELDPGAGSLDEGRRFPLCAPMELERVWRQAGLGDVASSAIETGTPFRDFDDYWEPFLGGQGPAPAYVSSLDHDRRETLREALRRRLDARAGGVSGLKARAWAVRGTSRTSGARKGPS